MLNINRGLQLIQSNVELIRNTRQQSSSQTLNRLHDGLIRYHCEGNSSFDSDTTCYNDNIHSNDPNKRQMIESTLRTIRFRSFLRFLPLLL